MRTATQNTHPACQALTALAGEIAAQIPGVRRDYATLDLMAGLMRRHGMSHAEDAIHEEARQRALHNRRAAAADRVAA